MLQLYKNFRVLKTVLIQIIKSGSPQVKYRVVDIETDENENYAAVIQMVNKSLVFRMLPEEILADDALTDAFSSRDIRTLTYLGYLGVNSPKYKILAKKLSEQDSRLLFAIKEKGKSKPIVRSFDELQNDVNFITSLDQKDAHMLGYVSAAEQEKQKSQQKAALLEQVLHESK